MTKNWTLSLMKPFAKNGLQNGFEILVDIESYDYTISPTDGEGIIIGILHHLDIPIMKNTGIRLDVFNIINTYN